MNLLYNSQGLPMSNNVYLLNVMLQPICKLNGIDYSSGDLNRKLTDFNELTFDVNKYIDIDETVVMSNGYDKLKIKSYLYVENIGYFKIVNEPSESYSDDKIVKTVTVKSIDCEAQQYNLVNFKVNCGTSDSLEYLADNNIGEDGLAKAYVKFYDETNTQLSLVHNLIKYIKGWSLGNVDISLRNKQEKFEIDSKPLYSFLREEVTQRFRCVVIFDILNLTINFYDVETFGTDTNIYLSRRNLVSSIEVSCDDSSVYTKYNVIGGNGLDNIKQVNYGENYIENKLYFMTTNYLPQETIDKYLFWYYYRNLKRDDYILLTKQYADINEKATDVYYRVPNDVLSDTWKGFDLDELYEQLAYYYALIATFENNADYFTDGEFDIDVLAESKKGYYSYLCYLDIVENIKVAIENYIMTQTLNSITEKYNEMNTALLSLSQENYPYKYESLTFIVGKLLYYKTNYSTVDKTEIDFDKDWETNWDLYGVSELQIKKEEYENKIDVTYTNIGYDISNYINNVTFDDLTSDEKMKYGIETTYNRLKAQYITLFSDYTGICNSLISRQSEYLTLQSQLDTLDTQISELTTKVNINTFDFDLTNSDTTSLTEILSSEYDATSVDRILNNIVNVTGFTNDELIAISRLDETVDYTNENIIVTSISTEVDKIDKQKELYEDASKQLVIQSQPQINITTELDNLLSLPEFKMWHEHLNLGSYIYLEMYEGYIVKQRLITISYNPFVYEENNFGIEFSNMLKSKQGVSDFVSLLGKAISGSTSNGVSNKSTTASSDLEISADVLQLIANSNAIKSKITESYNNSVDASNANFNCAFAEQLISKLAIIDEAKFNTFTANTGFLKYLESNLIVGGTVKTDTLISAIAQLGVTQMDTLNATSAFVQAMQSKVFTTDNATAFQTFTQNLVTNYLTVSSLFAQNTSTDFITLGTDSYGNKIRMNNQLMQFVDADNNVYIQIGLDTTGNPSIILKDSNGNVILNNNGITTDAIADELIVSDMIAPKSDTYNGIDASKLNIDSVINGINSNGSTSIHTSKIYYDSENQSLNTLLNTMTSTIVNVNGKLLYTVEISSSNGTTVTDGTILTANVYDYGTTTISSGSFLYQWYKNGTQISGATNSTLTLTSSDIGSGGQYTCKVSYD